MQGIVVFGEDAVCIAANDYAFSVLANLPDNVPLGGKEPFVKRGIVHVKEALGKAKVHGHNLVHVEHFVHANIRFLCRLNNQLLVKIFKAQLFCNTDSYFSTAGTKFAAYRYQFFHTATSKNLFTKPCSKN